MGYLLPVLFAIAFWWLSTVVIIYRAGLPRRSFGMTLFVTTLFGGLGIWALLASRADVSSAGAYLAFVGALLVWGWHEVTYLFGYVTGPRTQPCPDGVSGWQKFVLGVKTCVYHELAIVLTAAGLIALTWSAPNRVGLWTFVILWLMRWSVKLNIFLGVRNLHEEFWPEHLGYLKSFVTRRPMNELFPVSMLFATAVLAALGFIAVGAGDDASLRTGAMLLATLTALALIEHGLLVLRVKDDILWLPGMRSRRDQGASAG